VPRYGTGADLARELGISRQAVSKAEQTGRISRTADGKFDLDAARIQYGLHTNVEQRRRSLAQKGNGATTAIPEPLSTSEWRLRRERAEAERAELETGKLKSTLATTETIESRARRAGYAINGNLDQVPDRVAAECGADDAQRRKIRQVLQREMDRLRQEVADLLSAPAQ
jgi:phage terminase Nu1 subunit (DNA packaging protein)